MIIFYHVKIVIKKYIPWRCWRIPLKNVKVLSSLLGKTPSQRVQVEGLGIRIGIIIQYYDNTYAHRTMILALCQTTTILYDTLTMVENAWNIIYFVLCCIPSLAHDFPIKSGSTFPLLLLIAVAGVFQVPGKITRHPKRYGQAYARNANRLVTN